MLIVENSITPRAAQRRRELAASPTQLSPASPVTEEESSSVLQRVNRAVSASNWEEEARMPGEREIAREEPASKLTISDNQHRLDTMALERMAVFNTPLPPGAPGRRETKEVRHYIFYCLRHSVPVLNSTELRRPKATNSAASLATATYWLNGCDIEWRTGSGVSAGPPPS